MAAVTPAVIRQPPIGVALAAPSATPSTPSMTALSRMEKPSAAPSVREHELLLVGDADNMFVQLAAFATLDQAENFLSVIEFQLSGTGYSRNEISFTPRIRSRDNLFRVEIGPYATRVEAQRAAADLESRFGVVPSTSGR